jgi:hypothetical protein
MKKAILFSIMASLLLFSCKKEHSGGNGTGNPVSKTYKVNFNVSGFSQSTITTGINKTGVNSLKANSTTTTAPNMDFIYYYVFDSGGKQLHFATQDSTESNFGTISDVLPAGTYTIIIGAGKKGFSTFTYPVPVNTWFFSYNKTRNTEPNNHWQDTFYDKFQVTVSGDINQNVTMSRLIGVLEINILDVIPPTAKNITISVNNEDYFYTIFPGETPSQPDTLMSNNILPAAVNGTANYKKDIIIGNTTTPFNVVIVCSDASNKTLGTATISGVTCQKNTKTILSGNLFGQGSSFNITLNPLNPTPITVPF